VITGLISAGGLHPPPQSSWYHDGKFDMRNASDADQFDAWRNQLPSSQQTLIDNLTNDVQNGYSQGTEQHKANTDGTDVTSGH
jgi:hypothetical protein